MAFFFVTDPLMCARVKSDMSPSSLWRFEKNLKPIYTPQHELLLGLHFASRVTSKSNKTFVTLNEAREAWMAGTLEVDEKVNINDKLTTFGREEVSHILGIDIDAVLGEKEVINSQNIGKLIAMLQNRSTRAEILRDLKLFSAEVVTEIGFDTPPMKDLYPKDDPKVKAILDSHESQEVKYDKLNKRLNEIVQDTIDNLPDDNLSTLMKGSGRVKLGALREIYAPPIYSNGEVALSSSNLFEGLTERGIVTGAISNRKILLTKASATPVGGYVARQMILAQLELKFTTAPNSPDTIGLELPRDSAIGRTQLNGEEVTEFSPSRVRVKSCINHDDNIVYGDEIANGLFQEKDGSSIGIAFAMSFTEPRTQASLALKHGGTFESYEQEYVVAVHSGIVSEIGADWLTITNTSTGSEDKYPLTGEYVFSEIVAQGNQISKGDHLMSSSRVRPVWGAITDFGVLYGLNSSSSDLPYDRRNPVVNYAFASGPISYVDGKRGKRLVQIGSKSAWMSPEEVYYFPEGYSVTIGERISSGTLDPSSYYKVSGSKQFTFATLKAQVELLFNDRSMRPELYEVAFKCLMKNEFSARRRVSQSDNFINRMYSGDTKRGLKKFFKEGNTEITLEQSVLTPILLMSLEGLQE